MPVRHENKKMKFPPVVKLLVRGYIIIGFILMLEYFDIITNIGVIIFCITVISISMVFGIGYMLAMHSGPVRASKIDIPNTVLFFVKGSMIVYFVSLLAQFGLLPARIVSAIILILAGLMMFVGVLSYVYEVLQRARPMPKRRKIARRCVRPR